jgi:MFS family permease
MLTRPFAIVVAATFTVFVAIGMLLPVLPLYAKGPLGEGNLGVGIVIAAASPTALLFQPLAGKIGDRRGRRILIVAGSLVMAVPIALYTLVASLPLLVALRLVSGIGEALVFVGTATVINDLAPDERRGEAVSLYSLGVWGGLAIGPVVGETILDGDRYDTVWLVAAACAALGALAGLILPETRPERVEGPSRTRFIHPLAVAPGLVLVVSMFGFAGFNAFITLYARDLGLDGSGALFLLLSTIVVSIRVFGRRIPDEIGPKRASAASLVAITAGLILIGAWQTKVGIFAGTAVYAVGAALAFPALMTLAVGRAPASERSSVIGSFSASADLGFALGAIVLGGVASAAGYNAVFLAGGAAAAAGLLLLARIPAPLPAAPAPGLAQPPEVM